MGNKHTTMHHVRTAFIQNTNAVNPLKNSGYAVLVVYCPCRCHHRFEAKREKRQINFVGDKSWKVITEKYIEFYKTII